MKIFKLALIALLALNAIKLESAELGQVQEQAVQHIPKVVIIDISGEVTDQSNSKWLQQLYAAEKSSDAIILKICCPGGVANFTVPNKIKAISKKIPVVAYTEGVAASMGYAIASSSDKIICDASTTIGSIATIIRASENCPSIQSGKWKITGNKLTPHQKAMLKDLAAKMHSYFKNKVAEYRNLKLETSDMWGEGQIFIAEDALKLKLIDAIGTFDDAIEAVRCELKKRGISIQDGILLNFEPSTLGQITV